MKKIFILIMLIAAFIYKDEIINEFSNLKEEFIKSDIISENESIKIVSNETKYKSQEVNLKNFTYVNIGDDLSILLEKMGEPGRIDKSEYSFKWYVYNQDDVDFAMVGVEDNKVVALYSNTLNSQEIKDIKLNDIRDNIRNKYKSLEYRQKGNTRYKIQSDNQYDIIKIDKKFITVFYDKYDDNKVCSYQIISQKAENTLNGIYAKESEELKQAFELQTIDLVNSTRIKHNLNKLEYSKKASISSRKHSKDMEVKDYFDHENKDGESPFDRMKKEGIIYKGAGENIAAGQTSAIYAHEAWMNSLGHRKNILGDYKYLGVGVVFGGSYNIYYTQNFHI